MNTAPSLLTLGHPHLRRRSQAVLDPSDPALQAQIDQLVAVMKKAQGVGIAAPQIGFDQRVVVVASRPNPRYPHAPLMEPTVLINPRILARSAETELGWEGCLSVPGVRGQVPRATAVDVAYLDRSGKPQQVHWQGFIARILQHEYDHLEGHLFVDYLRPQSPQL